MEGAAERSAQGDSASPVMVGRSVSRVGAIQVALLWSSFTAVPAPDSWQRRSPSGWESDWCASSDQTSAFRTARRIAKLIGWADDVAGAARACGRTIRRGRRVRRTPRSPAAPPSLPGSLRLGDRRCRATRFLIDDPFAVLVALIVSKRKRPRRSHFESMATGIDASVTAMAARAGPDHAVYSQG